VRALPIKADHKRVAAYHASLAEFDRLGVKHETAVRAAFQALLEDCTSLVNKGRADKWKLVPEYSLKTRAGAKITPDGVLLDSFRLTHGVWEAKDTGDDLDKEIKAKFKLGYPRDNILFQAPTRAVLVQDGERVLDVDISKTGNLVEALKGFFEYQAPAFDEWEKAVSEFKERLPEIGREMTRLIRAEYKTNKIYTEAFDAFVALCRQALNPNLAVAAVEEMLIQHILTERIFRKIFDVGEFMQRNNIAAEIEKVAIALTSRSFSRDKFLKELDRFYVAIEDAAGTIPEFSEKQKFLNTVYEQFFQGFAVARADTLGIVYTPQEIVDFMLASVEEILKSEFGRTLGDPGIHVIDPFVGTGNFMVNLIRRLPKTRLEHKYRHELHCNEVMLLPYYVAAMNIEHTFYEQIGRYEAFPGICLVDTFETAEKAQAEFGFFNVENTERVKRQKAAPIFVIMGNPPYNAHQLNENDNNKNRKYEVVDSRVRHTYTVDSAATNNNALSDPYVKALRWASDRIGKEGIVAYVCNNSFVDDIAFDGVRKHLARDFDALYVLNLGGNVRKNPKLSGTIHNVFGIQVGVSINLFVRGGKHAIRPARIGYHAVPVGWRRAEKTAYLERSNKYSAVEWEEITPNKKYHWLTEGLLAEFDQFLPLGDVGGIFRTVSYGVQTNRDDWVFNFNRTTLETSVRQLIATYNSERERWHIKKRKKEQLDNFVTNDNRRIKWSSRLKECLLRNDTVEWNSKRIRSYLYRPYTSGLIYFDEVLVHRRSKLPTIFPTVASEGENRCLWLKIGSEVPFWCLTSNHIADAMTQGGTQIIPFYTYDDEGGARRENMPLSTLVRFRNHYGGEKITKWDIFHYIYAVLHHPEYRTRYAANLRRELPRIPLGGNDAKTFRAYAAIGKKLADLHVNYEEAAEYPLQRVENSDEPLNWRVEKMKLTKDKTALIYNDFLTLAGIPEAAFAYRLGNRSALEWVIDQYQVHTDPRSGITNDPNREDERDYIVKLIGKVITVSLETQKLIGQLPKLEIETRK
jgi:predicted helicase